VGSIINDLLLVGSLGVLSVIFDIATLSTETRSQKSINHIEVKRSRL